MINRTAAVGVLRGAETKGVYTNNNMKYIDEILYNYMKYITNMVYSIELLCKMCNITVYHSISAFNRHLKIHTVCACVYCVCVIMH